VTLSNVVWNEKAKMLIVNTDFIEPIPNLKYREMLVVKILDLSNYTQAYMLFVKTVLLLALVFLWIATLYQPNGTLYGIL
jgi:hypothetical protein